MTVQEAGRLGGLAGGRKGGLALKRVRGSAYYAKIGRRGAKRLRDLVEAGRRAVERASRRR